MLAGTFHLLCDHMPKVWKKVPAWLRAQIRQTMFDCGIDQNDMTANDIKNCIKYGQFLNQLHPQPKRKPR